MIDIVSIGAVLSIRILIEVSHVIVAKIYLIFVDVNTTQDIILESVFLQLCFTTVHIFNKCFVGGIIVFYGSVYFCSEIGIANYDSRDEGVLGKFVESKFSKYLSNITPKTTREAIGIAAILPFSSSARLSK